MTKQELVARLSEKTKLTQAEAFAAVEGVFDAITEALARGERVELRNFGIFDVRYRRPRIGRNPLDPKREYAVPAKAVVKFKAGKEMALSVGKLSQPQPSAPPPSPAN